MANETYQTELGQLYDFACRHIESGRRPRDSKWTQLREASVNLLRYGYSEEVNPEVKAEVFSLPTISEMELSYPAQMTKLLSLYEGESPSVGNVRRAWAFYRLMKATPQNS